MLTTVRDFACPLEVSVLSETPQSDLTSTPGTQQLQRFASNRTRPFLAEESQKEDQTALFCWFLSAAAQPLDTVRASSSSCALPF